MRITKSVDQCFIRGSKPYPFEHTHISSDSITMFKGGRPKKPVWQAFIMQGDKKAQCKQCFHILSAKVERLTAHHERFSVLNV